jgi:hypothetical protein
LAYFDNHPIKELTMFASLRRRRVAALTGTTFCESCSTVCTAGCRAQGHYDRVRTQALVHALPLR